MPVSRNRKKNSINDSKAKNTSTMNPLQLLNLHINNCRGCGSKRDEFILSELPDEEQGHWKELEIVDSIECFLYCSNCDEYSAIFEVEEF